MNTPININKQQKYYQILIRKKIKMRQADYLLLFQSIKNKIALPRNKQIKDTCIINQLPMISFLKNQQNILNSKYQKQKTNKQRKTQAKKTNNFNLYESIIYSHGVQLFLTRKKQKTADRYNPSQFLNL
ncbi:hypothetical protein ABPG72_002443 [Tetrahymena utriculariae]